MHPTSAWSLRNIYLYVVCLITLVMVILATVQVVRSAVELIYPEPEQPSVPRLVAPGERPIDPEAEAQLAEEQRAVQRQWNVRNAVLNLVRNGAMLLVAGPLYLYHWRKIEREAAA